MHAASSLGTPEEVTEWRKRAKSSSPPQPSRAEASRHPSSAEEGISIERVILRRGSSRKFAREPITRDQLSTMLRASTQPIWPGFSLLNDLYVIFNALDCLASGSYYFHADPAALDVLKHS